MDVDISLVGLFCYPLVLPHGQVLSLIGIKSVCYYLLLLLVVLIKLLDGIWMRHGCLFCDHVTFFV